MWCNLVFHGPCAYSILGFKPNSYQSPNLKRRGRKCQDYILQALQERKAFLQSGPTVSMMERRRRRYYFLRRSPISLWLAVPDGRKADIGSSSLSHTSCKQRQEKKLGTQGREPWDLGKA